jgi:small-conductance mechanosensitive channel
MRIEDVRSDLRFEIDNAFRENKVEIPFPQRVVWMKGGNENIN